MNRVIEILKHEGPMLSGGLAKALQMKYAMSNDSARKIISRSTLSSTPVQKISGIGFEKNQQYIYLKEQFSSEDYYKNLFNALKNSSKNYYQMLLAIQNNGGYISKNVLASYVAAPVENLNKHKKYDLIINKLIKLNFISEYDDDYYQLLYPYDVKLNIDNTKAIELAKKTVINDFNDWAKNLNLIAYNSSKGFFHCANFAKFQWCFTSPSYINDIADLNKSKPGFLVADVVIGKQVTVEDIQFFLDKVDTIKHFKNISSFIPMIIADNFSVDAHKVLKEKGIVIGKISYLFSRSYADILRELVSLLSNASAIISKNPQQFVEYISKITLLEGRMGNLIGDLFEVSVGYYFQTIGCRYIELNKIIKYDDYKKEIDVYIEKDGKIKIIECKGIKGSLDNEYVKKWLSENIPIIFKYIRSYDPSIIIEFELWSLGGYTEETLKLLDKAKANTKKYSISYYNGNEIKEMASNVECKVLLNSVKSILDGET